MVERIVERMVETGEWGEFFPTSLSSCGYNDSRAYDHFPLSQQEAEEKGFLWNSYVSPKVKGAKNIPASRLPDVIAEVPDDVLSWAIECEKDSKPFKLIPQELKFYRDQGLPIPHFCPDCRHQERISQINPRHLYSRKCAKCQSEIQTTYSRDRPEVVYCEECYLSEVY